MLADQISYLNSHIGSSDQKPGRDLYSRYDQLRKEFTEAVKELEMLKR